MGSEWAQNGGISDFDLAHLGALGRSGEIWGADAGAHRAPSHGNFSSGLLKDHFDVLRLFLAAFRLICQRVNDNQRH